jgi:cytochrome oxidase assembly protein ShyY1
MTATVGDTPRPTATLALDAVRLLREWKWLRSLVLVILFASACGILGHWQWSRHVNRSAAVHRVKTNYGAPAVPLVDLLPTADTAPTADLEWRRVEVSGTYLSDHTVLIRNRTLNGDYGYEVVVPLRTAVGAILLVDRGWLPRGGTGSRPESIPAPPTGRVEVVARLHRSEDSDGKTAPPGQAMQIDVPRLSVALDGPVYRAYGVLAAENPHPATAPSPLPRPDLGLGTHLAYALQWWVFSVGAFVLLGYYAFREAQNRDLRARGIDPATVRTRRSRLEPEEDEAW